MYHYFQVLLELIMEVTVITDVWLQASYVLQQGHWSLCTYPNPISPYLWDENSSEQHALCWKGESEALLIWVISKWPVQYITASHQPYSVADWAIGRGLPSSFWTLMGNGIHYYTYHWVLTIRSTQGTQVRQLTCVIQSDWIWLWNDI